MTAPIDLRAFLDRLRAEGELVEIEAEVDPRLEMAEVHRRAIAADGPALLFRRPKGASFPAVTNLFGSERRVRLAFGDRPEKLVERIARLPEDALPPTPSNLWAQRGLFASLARVGLRRRRRAPVNEVVDERSDLSTLPALTTWSRDGGPFVTLPLVLTAHPENGGLNLGMYRAQLFEDGGVGMHAQIGKGGGFHLAEAERIGRPLPVHVHVGGPPALVLAAIAPLPENVPEVLLASLVLGKRLELTRAPGTDLPLVARSEFVLAG
ncbi:MAG: UbiD family decarboxylase domain-containing protein, partial [Planctomycetota bacterium]